MDFMYCRENQRSGEPKVKGNRIAIEAYVNLLQKISFLYFHTKKDLTKTKEMQKYEPHRI